MDTRDARDVDERIAAAMRRIADSAAGPRGAAPASPGPPRRSGRLVLAAALAATALGSAVAVATHRSGSGTPGGPAYSGCRLDYEPRPLPTWARAGFTPPDQDMPYVLGDRGDIVAVLWATHEPLKAPPAAGESNKILWVARVGPGDGPLTIRATLDSTGRTVTRTVSPAPGPSGIDLPAPGCWSLDLRWGDHRDHLDLGYAAG